MKESVCAALILGLVWAGLVLLSAPARALPPEPETGAASEAAPETPRSDEPETEPAEAAGFDRGFRLPVLRDGQTVSMDLHDYLTGVLLGEVPADFAPEARKAQAVASRTYALYAYAHRRHGGAAVCTEPGCCQAWRDPAAADPAALAAAEAAVSETDGLAIYYRDKLIEATFFSCSGGRTEAAAAVWGTDLPYLQAVDSPGEEDSACFADELRVPEAEFRETLLREDPAVVFPAEKGAWVGAISRTPGGGVDRIELGGRPFTGTRIRSLFGLRSTAFALRLTETEAIFSTRGYGHRVGMSQYGAQAMAEAGADFTEILEHYYQGVSISSACE